MPIRLSQMQVDSYHRDGFVCPVDMISDDKTALLRRRLERAEQRYPHAVNAENRNNAHLVLKCVDEIAHHPSMLDAVEDLIGPDILIWGTVLFIKEPDSKAFVSWHQDMTYPPLHPHDGVTAWLALTPSNRESGCMRMIPGSHRGGIRAHHDRYGDHNILTRGQTVEGLDESLAVDVILEPGQISLHHGRTIHGSPANRSDHRRIGIAIQQYLPPHVKELHERGFAQLARGCDAHGHFTMIPRPEHDMTRAGIAARDSTNAHWVDFLYHGATERRTY